MFLPWSGDVHMVGYNPWINFCHFFHFVNFVIFWPQILWKCIDSGYLVSATLYTISCLFLCNFAHLFFHGLKMCMWFGFNPAVNFCHFSTLLTLSFFAGATSTSPKFDLYFSCPSYLPFWSYAPLKKSVWNLISKISLKYLYPPQNGVLGGYTVFSMSVIPKFRQHLMILRYNFASFCQILFKFTPHHNHQTMPVWQKNRG